MGYGDFGLAEKLSFLYTFGPGRGQRRSKSGVRYQKAEGKERNPIPVGDTMRGSPRRGIPVGDTIPIPRAGLGHVPVVMSHLTDAAALLTPKRTPEPGCLGEPLGG